MKKTVLILCLILFTLNFKSYASNKSFYSISKTILKTVQSNCKPISNNILSFPDTYKNLTTLSNCDLAFTINPKKYASITFDYLRAQQWLGIDVLEEKLNFVNQSYLPDSDFKLINKKVTLERMLKGDKGAFAHFLQQKYTKLSLNEVKKFEQFEDFNILKILYLEEEKLLSLINNYDDLNKYLDHYIKILYKTSSFYRPLISLNLIEIARKKFLKTSHFHSWEIFVQDMPYDVAKKFRIIFSFVDKKFFNNDLLWALKIRTFSEREKFSIYQLGYQKTFSQEMPNNVDTIYFSHLTNLNNIIFGNENGGPRLISLDLINGIHSLEKDHLKLREDYINFFPKIKNIGILNIDPNKLKKKFENFLLKQKSNASNLNEFEKKMLVSDIKNIYLYPYLKDAKYLSGYNYLSLALKNKKNLRIIEDLEDPLEKLIFFMKYERKREPKKSLEIIKSFEKNFNKVCLNKSLEMCDKSWRDINLGYLKSEIYIKNQFTEGPKSCKILKPFKFFYAQLSQKIGPDLYGYYGCNFNNLKQILNIKESHFFEKLPYILTTLGWNDGYYSATNESLLSRGAGFLTDGLLENRLDKRKLKLPHDTFNFLETTKDQKAFSYITNINKLKLPIFEKEEIKGDLPYYILSKIYTQLGNFERAFNANYVDLNLPETYSTKLPYAKFTSLSKLAMAKHNLRNMNIPEILIDQFTQPYHERIKQIKNKNENFITKDIKSNSTYNSDIDSMISVLNSYLSPLNNRTNSFKQKEDYLNFAGNIVGKNFQDKSLFCNEKSNRDLLFNLLKTSDGNKYITVATSGIDMFLFYEFAEIYFKCLNTELYTLKDKDLNSFKNFSKINYVLKNDFNKVLKLGFNYIDPRNIYSVLFLSNLARRVDNIYLSLMAVTSLEYMYQNLTNAFIKQNSLSLRLYQKFIEEIIVNTSISFSRFKPNNEKEEKLKEILGFKIKILSSSAKRVLLTNNSRLRYLGFDNQIFNNEKYLSSLLKKSSILKYNFNNLKKLTTFYKSLDQDISQSESLIDYVRTKSKYSEHGSDFFIDPFVDYRTYKQIKNTKFKFNIYSLLYAQGYLKIFSPTFDSEQNVIVKIDDKKIKYIKNKIAKNKFVNKQDANELCNIFTDVHSILNLSDKSYIMVIPSVNLLPIPSEIILGSYCKSDLKKEVSILHLADLRASLDFLQFNQKNIYPSSFVGIGNPVLNKRDNEEKLSINMFSSLFRGLSLDNNNNRNFIPLPEAEKEIEEISNLFEKKHIFLNEKASILNGLKVAEKDLGKDHKAIVIATHGFPLNLSKGVSFPSLLSIENKKQTFLNSTQISSFDLNNSTVVLSACDTASGLLKNSDLMFTGFVQSFANSGSNMIVSSLWPVETKSSQKYTTTFFKSWKSKSLIEAIRNSKNSVEDYLSLPFVTIYP